MEYHKAEDILHVMKLLGHKNIKNTLIYTQPAKSNEGENEYVSKVAKTVDEARALIESCFDYVCEVKGFKLQEEELSGLGFIPKIHESAGGGLRTQDRWRHPPQNPPFFIFSVGVFLLGC
jgi:hypothetical protein